MPATKGMPTLNYKYLRKRKWYRKFRHLLLPFYLAVLPLNLWHAWKWHGEPSFDWSIFVLGTFALMVIIYLVKFIAVHIVEDKKAYLPPWNK